MGKLVTQAASVNDSDHQLARFAQVNDYLFLMLYDEHFGKTGDPGPIASQQWFVERMRHMLRFVPRAEGDPDRRRVRLRLERRRQHRRTDSS